MQTGVITAPPAGIYCTAGLRSAGGGGIAVIAWNVCGMTVLLDFTAFAWLALLSLMQPPPVFCAALAACLLHESAHFLAMLLLRLKPRSLRISAVGLCLRMQGDALCPLPKLCAVLLAGPAANLAAFRLSGGALDAGNANLTLGLLNLLPFPGTDGGTLLLSLLEALWLTDHPGRIRTAVRRVSLTAAVLLAAAFAAAGVRSISMWGILLYLVLSGTAA